jgi:hypothetical protein
MCQIFWKNTFWVLVSREPEDLGNVLVLDSDTETDGTRVAVLKHESATSSQSLDDSLQNKVSNFVTNLKWRFNNWITQRASVGVDFMMPRSVSAAEKYLDLDKQCSLLDEFKFVVPKDPYLSPFFASKEDLERFPPVRTLVNAPPHLVLLLINVCADRSFRSVSGRLRDVLQEIKRTEQRCPLGHFVGFASRIFKLLSGKYRSRRVQNESRISF